MDLRVAAALFIALTLTAIHDVQSSDDKPVYFSLIVSEGEHGFKSSGGIPAIHIALEGIKNNSLLPGYDLKYELARNSKVKWLFDTYLYEAKFLLSTFYHRSYNNYSYFDKN